MTTINHYSASLKQAGVMLILLAFLALMVGCSSNALIKSNELLMANGDVGQAIQNTQEALAADSENHELYYHLATIYYRNGQYEKAQAEVSKAILLEPQNDTYRLLAGKVAFMLADYFDGTNHLINALLLNDTNLAAYYHLALTYQKTGHLDQASANLKTAIALEPMYFKAQLLLNTLAFEALKAKSLETRSTEKEEMGETVLDGNPFNFEQEVRELITRFSKALQINPKSEAGTILLAQMYQALGEFNRAREILRNWVKDYGTDSEKILFELADSYYRNAMFTEALKVIDTISEPSASTRILRLKTQRMINPSIDYDKDVRALLEENSDLAEGYLLLGQLEVRKGNHVEAESYFNICIDKNPDYAGCYYELSKTLAAQSDRFGSELFLKQAMKLAPLDTKIRIDYVKSLINRGDILAADTALANMVAEKMDMEVVFLKGIIAKEKKDYKRAEELFNYVHKHAFSTPVEIELADLEIRQGRYQQAEWRIESIERLAPGTLDLALVKAHLYTATDRADLVPDLLEPHLGNLDGGGNVHVILGTTFLNQNKIEKALQLFESGLRTWPRHPELTQMYTFALGLKEDYRRAIDLLEDMQRFKHKYNDLFYYRLRMYYYKTGKMEEFRNYKEPTWN